MTREYGDGGRVTASLSKAERLTALSRLELSESMWCDNDIDGLECMCKDARDISSSIARLYIPMYEATVLALEEEVMRLREGKQ